MVRTRFAPSPTGDLHIGGVRTALFSWLYARHCQGKFILRIEDTDRERSTDEAIQLILDGMVWLGLDADEGPYYQSARNENYKNVITKLMDSNHAYYCYCSKEDLEAMREKAMARGEKPKYDGRCRNRNTPPNSYETRVIRFKSPVDGKTVVKDLIQGEVIFQNTELDDLVIARSDGTPTYNLSVVVDDAEMEITHVIRGDDHLNNTPRQVNIFKALDMPVPEYAHIPLILDENGKKLSKRHGAASVLRYKEEGILAEALLNYLVRLGWSHGDQEVFSIDEMSELFELENVNKSAAALNPDKLSWLNQQYLKNYNSADLVPLLKEQMERQSINYTQGPDLAKVCNIQKERVRTLEEMAVQSRYFYEDFDDFDPVASKKHLRPVISGPLLEVRNRLMELEHWDSDAIHQSVTRYCEEYEIKMGKVAQPIRVAVTGSGVSPSIDVTLELIGKERVINRLDKALEYIQARST
ncbi:MAG: glutamate--tRNA ligase [Gammaproteobacteria bacterium]|nr:glutamate--tRNA ligase [Gammaproteobacteria bacterium]